MSSKQETEEALDWLMQDKQLSEQGQEAEVIAVSGDLLLKGSFGIAEAEFMHQKFSRILNAHVDISIQAEGLNRVDTAGVQLLYALVKEAKSRAVSLTWLSVSDVLVDAAETLGVTKGMGFEASDV